MVMPKGSPAFAADSAVRLAMATTSTPGMACSLGMWCSLVLPPAPMHHGGLGCLARIPFWTRVQHHNVNEDVYEGCALKAACSLSHALS